VKSRRDGRMVYYSLADEHVAKLMETGLRHERE
jgi:DNA-binding transcriptional ArsR family regulator